jgi:hypothetical protein
MFLEIDRIPGLVRQCDVWKTFAHLRADLVKIEYR